MPPAKSLVKPQVGSVQISCRPWGKSRQSDFIAACAALEPDITHISGFERLGRSHRDALERALGLSQLLLLPEAGDDYVAAGNSVLFIDAFVDGLDLAAAGFHRVEPKVTGRPGYAPGQQQGPQRYEELAAPSRARTKIEDQDHLTLTDASNSDFCN
jgi:hypothetical protein